MTLARRPNDRYGWFCFYTDRWAVRYINCDAELMAQCEQLALWYYLLHITGEENAWEAAA